ncbi:MAG TPA: 2-isopropylmalate synthase, partial [Ruminiclostridium sp.]|nr:2-isopropylmalate synthase [Ruminiclostridium sp.]
MNESLWKNENWWVSEYNFYPEVLKKSPIPANLQFHDVTLRDGEQTPGVVFRKEEKIEIARRLDEAGVQRIEAGMPAVSQEDRSAIEEIRKLNLNAQVFAFARPLESDINLCRDCGVQGLIIEVPIGRPKLQYQFKYGIEQALENSQKAVQYAKNAGLKVVLFPYDATRAEKKD